MASAAGWRKRADLSAIVEIDWPGYGKIARLISDKPQEEMAGAPGAAPRAPDKTVIFRWR